MSCGVCGAENEVARKFCGECGASLALTCAQCGTANAAGTKFCGECGSSIAVPVAAPAAHLAEATDPEECDRLFRRSAATLRELGASFRLAVVQTEHAEALLCRGADDDVPALLAEARETFERLEATPWLERVDRLVGAEASV